ncbi:MAG: Gfo/Idh/MocA family oxidoreductase [Planctomycetota bacterium]|jgi:predicted dehydrogenase|nr:Gfo/Idh/MocA family oxidoreductase [Planctomycetota bacterium]MDP7252944.1 Gfo/Idh/MocA family oxidoreductase [Planctomycetota bacterium]
MSDRKFRVGFAGLVHDHVWWEFDKWKKLDNVDLVAAGDANPPQLEKAQKEYGVTNLYSSWQEMLESEELDVLQVAVENSKGADVVEAAAARGIHVTSEKPMSARLSQANRMIKASEDAGTKLLINWPSAWSPAINTMAKVIDAGDVGRLHYFKQRSAHNGPKELGCSTYFYEWLYDADLNGAGALMDYCCYSADMCSYFLGLPNSVVGIRSILAKDYPLPDDNAMILMKYDHAFGVAEACWTQVADVITGNPVAYGSEGALMVKGDKVILSKPGQSPKEIDAEPFPDGRSTGPEYLLTCIETGEEVEGMCSPKISRDAQEILEAGLISSDTGKEVKLPLVEFG